MLSCKNTARPPAVVFFRNSCRPAASRCASQIFTPLLEPAVIVTSISGKCRHWCLHADGGVIAKAANDYPFRGVSVSRTPDARVTSLTYVYGISNVATSLDARHFPVPRASFRYSARCAIPPCVFRRKSRDPDHTQQTCDLVRPYATLWRRLCTIETAFAPSDDIWYS